ncbi:PEP-CTERM sorting domain-containing protein [Methylophilus sp. UBA6697]|jgi:hypothetical protein|uniref:PEP-CTERM sorting domain-containing protein n=1 Tax=Methylophilus sp. UBA6697 TaxID=1946902 RepID=UPI000EC73B83|nr:PEP-CTERM sorting domain-containing protein [Methylophilus sp. UBA6697]HCU84093.1 PEP-CTERM sorting domain-containing protein [Methylophilus sp.]
MASTIKKAILAASISLASLNTQAALTSYNANGVDLVYSSVSNVTWTKDGNLLGSMIASDGFHNVINAIITASPLITNTPNYWDNYTGVYTVTETDFGSSGQVNWYGAMAFINYLNSINYGGSNQWQLPTVIDRGADGCNYAVGGTDCGWNVVTNGNLLGNELPELYYTELGGKGSVDSNGNYQPDFGIPATSQFENTSHLYFTATEYAPGQSGAWFFSTSDGYQGFTTKLDPWQYVWAITQNPTTTVPEPENLTMLLAGLGLLGVAVRRSKQA